MNETLIIIDATAKLILNVVIICAIGTVIYYRKRILEALEEIGRRDPQNSHNEDGVAFMKGGDVDVNRELR